MGFRLRNSQYLRLELYAVLGIGLASYYNLTYIVTVYRHIHFTDIETRWYVGSLNCYNWLQAQNIRIRGRSLDWTIQALY